MTFGRSTVTIGRGSLENQHTITSGCMGHKELPRRTTFQDRVTIRRVGWTATVLCGFLADKAITRSISQVSKCFTAVAMISVAAQRTVILRSGVGRSVEV